MPLRVLGIEIPDLVENAAVTLLASCIPLGVYTYARALPSCGTIVWLRQFGPTSGGQRFAGLLEAAARGVAQPITLQDASGYSGSHTTAVIRSTPLAGLPFQVWWAAVLLWGCAAPLLHGSMIGLFVGVATSAAIMIGVGYVRLRHLAHRVVTAEQARRELDRAATTRGRILRRPAFGLEVLKVAGEAWHDVVGYALSGAVLAIIDVTKVTKNIEWELETALRSLHPDRIILAAQAGSDRKRIWGVVKTAADAASCTVTTAWLDAALFTYPVDDKSQVDPGSPEVERLGRLLVRRLRAAESADNQQRPGRVTK
jgi:hypothetical protein